MRYSLLQKRFLANASLWASYANLCAVFLPAFALHLGADNFFIGFLAAIPWIAMLLAELPGGKLVEYFSRKSIYVFLSGISRLSWAGVFLAPWLYSKNHLILVALFVFARWIAEHATDAAFTSFLADVVPMQKWGRFFAQRLWLMALFGALATLVGGYALRIFGGSTKNFALLFSTSIVIGLLATYQIAKVKEPSYRDNRHHALKEYFTPSKKFLKYVRFEMFFDFAYYFASPFFAVYQLKELELDYGSYALASVLPSFAALVFQKRFGALADKFGDKPIAIISILGISVFSAMYAFITPSVKWLIWPAAIIAGIAWAGADLSTFNLLLDLSHPKTRALCISQCRFFSSFSYITAPLIAGWLSNQSLPGLKGLTLVFAISAVLRAASILLLAEIPEPRAKHSYPLKEVVRSAFSFHPEKIEYRVRFTLHKIEKDFGRRVKGFVREIKNFD